MNNTNYNSYTIEINSNYIGEIEFRLFTHEGILLKTVFFNKQTEHFSQKIDILNLKQNFYLAEFIFGKSVVRKIISKC